MNPGFLDKLVERLDRLDTESLQGHFLRLAGEKGFLEAIFQALQEGLIVVDGHGRILYANQAAERMLGFDLKSARGRSMFEQLKGIEWDRILDLDLGEWTKLINRDIEVAYPEYRVLNFYVVPLAPEPDGEKSAVIMLRDITHNRRQEDARLESERLNAIIPLAAGVAHEIGNPLNALTIHLQLLEREIRALNAPVRDEMIDLLRVASVEVNRLDTIINNFLRAVRPTPLQTVQLSLEELLRETLGLLQSSIEDRRIRIAVESPAVMPPVPADGDQLKQAFFNLLKNALQATPDDGRIDITLWHDDIEAGVTFHDYGAGIAPEDFGRILDPYYTTKVDGTGLGLVIVQRIVRDHGGRLDVRSEPGQGCIFTLTLPLAERRIRLLKASGNHPGDVAETTGGDTGS